jgi:hypothetical protein
MFTGYWVSVLFVSFFSIPWAKMLSVMGVFFSLVLVAAAVEAHATLPPWRSMTTRDWTFLLIAMVLIAVLNPVTMWYLAPVLFHAETGLLTPLFGKEISLWIGLFLFRFGWGIAFIIGGITYFIANRKEK